MLYPLAFLPVVTLMNVLYFAGCAPKLPGRMYFAPSRAAECIADYSRMVDNLSVLALPGYGIALFALGWAIAAVAHAARDPVAGALTGGRHGRVSSRSTQWRSGSSHEGSAMP